MVAMKTAATIATKKVIGSMGYTCMLSGLGSAILEQMCSIPKVSPPCLLCLNIDTFILEQLSKPVTVEMHDHHE